MKIQAENPKAQYCSIAAILYGMIEPKKFKVGGSDVKTQNDSRTTLWRSKETYAHAEKLMANWEAIKSLEYRQKMEEKWRNIIIKEEETENRSIEVFTAVNQKTKKPLHESKMSPMQHSMKQKAY